MKGPTVWFPGPFERSGSKMTAIALQDDEYIKVKDTSLGYDWQVFKLCPKHSTCFAIYSFYILLRHHVCAEVLWEKMGPTGQSSGVSRAHLASGRGRSTSMGGLAAWVVPFFHVAAIGLQALKSYEYVRLVNQVTGKAQQTHLIIVKR